MESGDQLRVLNYKGEAGIGKTSILREVISLAESRSLHVCECRSSSAETRLGFAGLTDLLASIDDHDLSTLPAPQRRALEAALLRIETDAGGGSMQLDPRTIGTSVVSLLTTLARNNPVVLIVDDVQWLDLATARTLDFALRRLEHSDVVVVTSERTNEPGDWLRFTAAISAERVRTCQVGPLPRTVLQAIIKKTFGAKLTGPLFRRIERAAAGNPLYAAEISRALLAQTDSNRSNDVPVPEGIRDLVAGRIHTLPTATQHELLRASAVSTPNLSLLDLTALGPAEEAGFVSIRDDGRVEFAHPLFASAVYAGASTLRRQRVHAQLAKEVAGIEEQAVHQQRSAVPPDAVIAAALGLAAESAFRRGAVDAAAEFAHHAANFTSAEDTEILAERTVRAARFHLSAGDPVKARALSKQVLASPSPGHRVEALQVMAETVAHDDLPAASRLLRDALELAAQHPQQVAQLHLGLGLMAIGLAQPTQAKDHLNQALEAAVLSGARQVEAEALGQLALVGIMKGEGFHETMLLRALEFEDRERFSVLQTSPSLAAAMTYEYLGMLDRARSLLLPLREALVARGSENELAYVLTHLGATSYLGGDLVTAEHELGEALHSATLAGQDLFYAYALVIRGMVRAALGNIEAARRDATEALQLADRIGWSVGVGQATWTLGHISLTEGDMETTASLLGTLYPAIEAEGLFEYPNAGPIPDTIEALIAVGQLDDADRLIGSFTAFGRRFDRPWILATAGRCAALLHAARGDLDAAERAAFFALDDHKRLPMPLELARTLLVLGQVQRRSGHRRDAQHTLEKAQTLFNEMEAAPWAERAAAELRRIGIRHAPKHLTESENNVATLAAQGLTNKEIAARLFISQRTVESTLARAYRKLGINSRAQLGATVARRIV